MSKIIKTSDGKQGGLLQGKSHAKGGIKAVVVDTGQPVELEKDEVIINAQASKLNCEELDRINQSTGGVPIPCDIQSKANTSKYQLGGIIKPTRYEINNIISGVSSVTNGTAIQAAASYLRGSKGSSRESGSSHLKRQDEERLREYISKNNLWLPLPDSKKKIGQGGEAQVYFDGDYVIKINDAHFYGSWEDYFNSLLIHNFLFPITSYELIGFSEYKDHDNRILYAVVRQPFIKETTATNRMEIRKVMSDLGFIYQPGNHYYNSELNIELKDLHEGNVLTKDGVPYFIDTIFYIKDNKMENGGKVEAIWNRWDYDTRKNFLSEHRSELRPLSDETIKEIPLVAYEYLSYTVKNVLNKYLNMEKDKMWKGGKTKYNTGGSIECLCKEKLGDKHISEGTIITDKRTGIPSQVQEVSQDGVTLKPLSSFESFPSQTFEASWAEIENKFVNGDIDISGYEHTEADNKILYLVSRDIQRGEIEEEEIVEEPIAEEKDTTYAKGGSICPVGTTTQTLIFKKSNFTKQQAKDWAKDNNYDFGKVDEKSSSYRLRQAKPSSFRKNSLRTIKFTDGVSAVIGCPKGK